MDALEFDSMGPAERWEYFWEYGLLIDQVKEGHVDYFLFKHKEIAKLYMELYRVDNS